MGHERKGCDMKVVVDLTREEVAYITTCCIGRVMSSVIDAVPENYDHMLDLEDLRRIMEPLRYKMVSAIYEATMEQKKSGTARKT